MSKSPAFQFYVRDWLSSIPVGMMTWEERGIFVHLLCYAWLNGGLPPEDRDISDLLSLDIRVWRRVKPRIAQRFHLGKNGLLVNDKQEEIRRKQEVHRLISAKGGRVKPGTEMEPKANRTPTEMEPKANTASASASAGTTTTRTESPPTPREDGQDDKARDFLEQFTKSHAEIRGAVYCGPPSLDFTTAQRLVQLWPEADFLHKMAELYLADGAKGDEFIRRGTRSVGKFAARASQYAELVTTTSPESSTQWDDFVGQLEGHLSARLVSQWFGDAEFVSWDETTKTLRVRMPKHKIEHVKANYPHALDTCLPEGTGATLDLIPTEDATE